MGGVKIQRKTFFTIFAVIKTEDILILKKPIFS